MSAWPSARALTSSPAATSSAKTTAKAARTLLLSHAGRQPSSSGTSTGGWLAMAVAELWWPSERPCVLEKPSLPDGRFSQSSLDCLLRYLECVR